MPIKDYTSGAILLAHDRTPTFAGVLHRYFNEKGPNKEEIGICKDWNDETQDKYLEDYFKRIIPSIERLYGPQKPMHELLEDDFDAILREIDPQFKYKPTTRRHYEYLIQVVYTAGAEHNLYQDIVYLGGLSDEELTEKDKVKRLIRIPRSFSIVQECRIIEWIKSLDPVTADGEEVGLIIMFCIGVRNNEACGIEYASIHALKGNDDVKVVDIVQSTMLGSNEVKAGGKTSNAPRVLPLQPFLFDFLMKRKEGIRKKIESGKIILPEKTDSIDKLPVVCRGNDYCVRSDSRKLTAAGRSLFNRIGISKEGMGELYKTLHDEEFKSLDLDEKEPTTYLFRRNTATHLYQMGFSLPEIQYLIGHEIEDDRMSRNDFNDPEMLASLNERMKAHPINALMGGDNDGVVMMDDENCFFSREAVEAVSIKITTSKDNAKYMLNLKMREPGQTAQITLKNKRKIAATGYMQGYRAYAGRTVSMNRIIWDAYKKEGGKKDE